MKKKHQIPYLNDLLDYDEDEEEFEVEPYEDTYDYDYESALEP